MKQQSLGSKAAQELLSNLKQPGGPTQDAASTAQPGQTGGIACPCATEAPSAAVANTISLSQRADELLGQSNALEQIRSLAQNAAGSASGNSASSASDSSAGSASGSSASEFKQRSVDPFRISTSGDDAAGMAVGTGLRPAMPVLAQATNAAAACQQENDTPAFAQDAALNVLANSAAKLTASLQMSVQHIRDADQAQDIARTMQAAIHTQAGISVLAQPNQLASSVLAMLK